MEKKYQPTAATSIKLAANITGLRGVTISRLVKYGTIPHTKSDNNQIEFDVRELHIWMLSDSYDKAVMEEKKEDDLIYKSTKF